MKNSNKKILIAASIFSPDIGGPAVYSARLEQELKSRKFVIGVVSYSLNIPKILPAGVRHFAYLVKLWFLLGAYDVVYAQNAVSVGLPAWFAARFRINKKRLVIKIVGDVAWERARERGITQDDFNVFQNRKYGFRVWLLRRVQNFVAKRADSIIVPSSYLSWAIEGWGVSGSKIKVIYNSYRATGENPPRKVWRQSISGSASYGPLLVSVGRLISLKGFDELIDIVPGLQKKVSDIRLIIVGDGPLLENLNSKIKELGLENAVQMAGWRDHGDVMKYIGAADVFVLNSHHEGLPHTVLEAMTVGAPIVATRVGGVPELIEDGVNGFLIEPHNGEDLSQKIVTLLRSRELQEKFSKVNKERIKDFSFKSMVDQTIYVLTA